MLQSWTPTLHRIEDIDAPRRVVRFHSTHSRTVDFWERNFRYYLSNVFEALDEPGEWYLNRHTGMLSVIQLTPRGLDRGPVRLSFAVMLHADTPAPMNVEFRGAGGTGETGPSLRFQADGRLLASGKEVLQAPPGTWTHVEIAFHLDADAPRTYTLTLQHDQTTTQHVLPFRHATFDEVRWLGFYASDDVDGIFYLDEMKLSLEE